MKKIVITRIKDQNILFLFDDEHELSFVKVLKESLIDSVYVARIDSINKGMNSCFVTYAPGKNAFLPLEEFKDREYKCGDEILIQIKTDALKTKLPEAGLDICIPGEYSVIHLYGHGLSASRKLSPSTQKSLIESLNNEKIEGLKKYKTVIRTNSELLLNDESLSPLFKEVKNSLDIIREIDLKKDNRKLYSKLYESADPVSGIIKDISLNDFDSVVTDIPEIYESLVSSLKFSSKEIKFYDDTAVSLINLYSLKTHLSRLLDTKVYLPSGGYLIIEKTEAMTVIDVNSGKAEVKRHGSDDYIFRINKEAALEVARSLRLRNISGIIMVDFINMSKTEDEERLLNLLNEELKKDKITARAIDITPLGIAEITRKKVDIPLDKAIFL